MGGGGFVFSFLVVFALASAAQDSNPPSNPVVRDRIEALKSRLAQTQNLLLHLDPDSQELRAALDFRANAQPHRDPRDVAVDFVGQIAALLFNASGGRSVQLHGTPGASGGAAPLDLELERDHSSRQGRHLLFSALLNGIPIEFSRIGVQLTSQNEVAGVLSGLEGELVGLSPVPLVTEGEARGAVEQAWTHGRPLSGVAGVLVYLPKRFEQETKPAGFKARVHLAWKFRFRLGDPFGLWSVYVDAHAGVIIGAVNELRSGAVPIRAAHWCRDPATDCSPSDAAAYWSTSPVRGAFAWEQAAGGSLTQLTASPAGVVDHTSAKSLFATLRTTYAVVVDDLGLNPVYSEGGASWTNVIISSASDSPYGVNISKTQSYSCPGSSVFSVIRFTSFDVGLILAANGAQDDLDVVEVLDGASGPRLAAYIGAGRGAFNTVASTGPTAVLRLKSNATDGAGNETGYAVNITSCLVQTSNAAGDPAEILFTHPSGNSGSFALNNVFEHLSNINVYISSGGSIGDTRWNDAIKSPVIAHVNFGSNLANDFYDPDLDALFFGQGSPGNLNRNTALATDVIFHEFIHWAVNRIYTLPNFGSAGAVSEALSDFFALDAYNDRYPALPKTTFGEWAFPGQSRQLAQTTKRTYPSSWTSEIHEDGLILSGALWDLRGAIGSFASRELARAALFYFPDSFDSFFMAMLAASRDRFSAQYDNQIVQAFSAHGIGIWPISIGGVAGDALEPNDGFSTARQIVSGSPVKATVFPAGDVDFYRFTAGAGAVSLTLTRPFDSQALMYLGYGFQVFDLNRQLLAQALPSTLFEFGGNSLVTEQTAQASLTLSSPQLLYVAVSAPLDANFSNNDKTNSAFLKYTLGASFNAPTGALTASRVSASMADQRKIKVTATGLTGFSSGQSSEATVDHVDILDHNRVKLADGSGSNLTLSSLTQKPGLLEVTVELPSNFFSRYPASGAIYLEVFAKNSLGTVYSLGLSNEVKILGDSVALTAYNNVFNPVKGEQAILKYQSGGDGHHRLAVYTMAGNLVKLLVDRDESAGLGSVSWDGKNGEGDTVASGVYLVHLEAPGGRKTQKVIVVK